MLPSWHLEYLELPVHGKHSVDSQLSVIIGITPRRRVSIWTSTAAFSKEGLRDAEVRECLGIMRQPLKRCRSLPLTSDRNTRKSVVECRGKRRWRNRLIFCKEHW